MPAAPDVTAGESGEGKCSSCVTFFKSRSCCDVVWSFLSCIITRHTSIAGFFFLCSLSVQSLFIFLSLLPFHLLSLDSFWCLSFFKSFSALVSARRVACTVLALCGTSISAFPLFLFKSLFFHTTYSVFPLIFRSLVFFWFFHVFARSVFKVCVLLLPLPIFLSQMQQPSRKRQLVHSLLRKHPHLESRICNLEV